MTTITIQTHHAKALVSALRNYQELLNKLENESHYPTNMYHHVYCTAMLHDIYNQLPELKDYNGYPNERNK